VEAAVPGVGDLLSAAPESGGLGGALGGLAPAAGGGAGKLGGLAAGFSNLGLDAGMVLNGATDAEIEDAVHWAKSQAGWSTYINGMQVDYDQFKSEVLRACEHVRKKAGKAA